MRQRRASTSSYLLCAERLLYGLSRIVDSLTFNVPYDSVVYSFTNDQVGSGEWGIEYPAVLPSWGTSSSSDGGSTSETDSVLSNTGFEFAFDLSRTAITSNFFQAVAYIDFTPDQFVKYDLSGSLTSVDSEGRALHLRVDLHETNAGPLVYYSSQLSQSTPNESFTLGGSGGDVSNLRIGTSRGTLSSGRHYTFHYLAEIGATPIGGLTSGAAAKGNISLNSSPSPVPSMSPAALLLLKGFVVLESYRRA